MHSGQCCERGFAPNGQRRLDAEVVHVFREVAAEFSCWSSATKGKSDAERHGAVISDPAVTAIDQICRGADEPRQRADAFAAHLVWLSETPLLPGRGYLLKPERNLPPQHCHRRADRL